MDKLNKILMLVLAVIGTMIPMLKSEDSKKGVKELKEALIAAFEIGLLVFRKFKDGVQFSDFADFYKALTEDEDFKSKVSAGYDKYGEIPAEIEDADAGEGLELVQVAIEYTPKFLEVAKKEEK